MANGCQEPWEPGGDELHHKEMDFEKLCLKRKGFGGGRGRYLYLEDLRNWREITALRVFDN